MSAPPGVRPIEAFAYTADDQAPLYRAIMRAFVESKDRFVFQLRLSDVLAVIPSSGLRDCPDSDQINAALTRLCEWGHLQKHTDVRDAVSVEDFLTQHHTFRLTSQGEAAEKALASFDAASDAASDTAERSENELHTTALSDIRRLLQELLELSGRTEPDPTQVHSNILLLQARFETVTATAQDLIGRLEAGALSQTADTQRVLQYGEQFLSELVLTADATAKAVHDIGPSGLERLIQIVARRSIHDSRTMKSHWDRFCHWFISEPGRLSHAEVLRERVRPLITAGLNAIARANDRRIHRIDRASDFRVLARWFTQAESDSDAHRLWRLAFGLGSVRHLVVNDQTLDEHETHDVPSNTSWLDAPPLRISKRFRHYSDSPQTGMLSRIVDRTAEKAKLAAASHEEALRLLRAQNRFGTGHRIRLSELEQLEAGEFDMLLDLLGEAVSARVFPNEVVEILSPDGSLSIKLEPTDDGRSAMISTNDGMLSGPDQWIQIDPISTESVESQQC